MNPADLICRNPFDWLGVYFDFHTWDKIRLAMCSGCWADHQAHPEGCTNGLTEEECPVPNDWREGEVCGDTLCCPIPWADIDGDEDVDLVDFGLWQVCFTSTGGGVNSGCECYDRDDSTGAQGGDGLDVDGQDFVWFNNCFTGPTVPLTDPPPAGCIP